MDSSSFAKLFLAEIGGDALRALVQTIDDEQKNLSVLAHLEVRSALERRLRLAEISHHQYTVAGNDLKASLLRYVSLPADSQIIETASNVIGRHGLRALDAIQLATALELRDRLDPEDDFLFVASDHRLLAAARAEAMSVWDPGTASSPPTVPVN